MCSRSVKRVSTIFWGVTRVLMELHRAVSGITESVWSVLMNIRGILIYFFGGENH